MSTKTVTQMYLIETPPSSATKTVAAYRAKYAALNELLLANRAVLDLVHADFCRWLSASEEGRASGYTSEEILRVLVVMFVEGDSYRDVVVRIANSEFLCGFVGLGFYKPMMEFSFVGKAFAALSEETWQPVNRSLAAHAKAEEWITGEKPRTDTTACEANIHYPADSSLLWGGLPRADACPAGEKFISHYRVMPKREEDKDLVDETLAAHRGLFGAPPKQLAADKGFHESAKRLEELREEIETVSISKKGRRTEEEEAREHGEEFPDGQRFRAGVEGSISVLKRAFKMYRCLFKGFKNFAASVGCAVFCHTPVRLSNLI